MKGNRNTVINSVAPIDSSTSSDLSFCSSDDYEGIVSILRSNAGIILCKRKLLNLVNPSSDRNKTKVIDNNNYNDENIINNKKKEDKQLLV
ncbi:MAG: hypothetical protein ACRD6Q_06885, partial [Nitrososphaeraceae archaeon]